MKDLIALFVALTINMIFTYLFCLLFVYDKETSFALSMIILGGIVSMKIYYSVKSIIDRP